MRKLKLSSVDRNEIVDDIVKRLSHLRISINPRTVSYLPGKVIIPLDFPEPRNASIILTPYGAGRYKIDLCIEFENENDDIIESLVSEDWTDLAPFVTSILKRLITQHILTLN